MDSKLLCDLYRAMIYGGEMVIYRGTAPDDVVADFVRALDELVLLHDTTMKVRITDQQPAARGRGMSKLFGIDRVPRYIFAPGPFTILTKDKKIAGAFPNPIIAYPLDGDPIDGHVAGRQQAPHSAKREAE